MSQAIFDSDLWPVLDWRGLEPNPAKTAAIAYHRAVKAGADPRQIVAGAIGCRQFYEICDKDPQFRCTGAKFISEERWEQYLGQREAKEYLESLRPELRVVTG